MLDVPKSENSHPHPTVIHIRKRINAQPELILCALARQTMDAAPKSGMLPKSTTVLGQFQTLEFISTLHPHARYVWIPSHGNRE
jgi:hypothetical protein